MDTNSECPVPIVSRNGRCGWHNVNLVNLENRRNAVLYSAAFGAAVFALLWARRPDALLNAQFWAEDGGVFFQDQMVHGFWGSIARPYSGYLHVIPRLVAALICQLPVRWAPFGFNLCALLLEAVCCSAFAWPCFRPILRSDSLRAACCLAATCCPLAGSELIGTISNIQWFLGILSLLLVFVKGGSRVEEAVLSVGQMAIALTAPVTLLYLPILFWQLRRNPKEFKPRPALHVLALLIQLMAMRHGMAGPKPVLRFSSLFTAAVASAVSRCVLTPLIGFDFLQTDSEVTLFTKFAIALMAGSVLLTIAVMRIRQARARWALVMAAYVGAGSLLAILWGRSVVNQFQTMEGLRHYTAERYFFTGSCLFVFTMAVVFDNITRPAQRRFSALLLLLVFAFGARQNFQARVFADMDWPRNAAQIEAWKTARRANRHPAALRVPINPAGLALVLEEN